MFFVSIQDVFFILIICCFIFISVFVNFESSGNISGDNGVGLDYMLSSSVSLCGFFVFSLYFKHMLLEIKPDLLSKTVKMSFILMFTYVLLELFFYVLPIEAPFQSIMDGVESLFHDRQRENYMQNMHRVRGFAFEPSYLVPVLFFMLPFLIHNRKLLYAWCLTLLLTFSPTAYLAGIVFYILYRAKKSLIIIVSFISVVSFSVFSYFIISEIVIIPWELFPSSSIRIGSWVASISVILDNILFGVGPGMSGYWVVMYYPEFFYKSGDASSWIHLGMREFAAPTFASILTLTSSIGILPILYIIFYFFFRKRKSDLNGGRIVKASLVAMAISSLGVNDYAFSGFWIFFSMTLAGNWHVLRAESNRL